MFKFLVSVIALCAIMSIASAQDYMFPSTRPPANLAPSSIPMYVCLMWDDVAYSGLSGSTYESDTNQPWAKINRVDGKNPITGTTSPNTFSLKAGDIGGSWACRTLLPTGNNPDGSKKTMTFSPITGQMAAVTWATSWVENPTKDQVWGWRKQWYQTVNWADKKKVIGAPVCWGREYAVFTNGGSGQEEDDFTAKIYRELKTKGMDIGSHTLDHMETNSGLRKAFWPNGGEGYDPGMGAEKDLAGNPWKEQFGAWDSIGWDVLAGAKISKECWKGVLELAATEFKDSLQITVGNGLYGFRAPRLEVNGNMLLALKELGYTYDCSIEETNQRTGTDHGVARGGRNPNDSFFVGGYWPYTFDNGSPSQWYIQDAGDGWNAVTKKPLFSEYPPGLWEIPSQVFIVPQDIRSGVWDRAKEISSHAPEGDSIEPKESWVKHGRLTGFDFNLFVLWGMTKADFVATMKHNLDLNMIGGKAPFIFGLHCDYFTPMYDYATLLDPYNASSYGLNVTKGWNTWKLRKEAMTEFVTYAASKNCNFVSGIELIKKMRELQAKDNPGTATVCSDAEWDFFADGGSTTNTQTFTGNISNAQISLKANEGYCGYDCSEGAGYYEKLDHISLTYQCNSPLRLILVMEDGYDKDWQVLLNNVGPQVNSGKIPISAFDYFPNDTGTQPSINTAKITGITVQVAFPDLENKGDQSITMNVSNLTLYGALCITGIQDLNNKLALGTTSLNAINRNLLKLNIGQKGMYSINIISASGKVVRSFKNVNCEAGFRSFGLNNLSSGAYVIKINTPKGVAVLKRMVM